MPRASLDHVVQSLFHEEPRVREIALRHLTEARQTDPAVLPRIGESLDRFGFGERWLYLVNMARQPQSAASIEWVLKWLGQTTPTGPFESIHPLLVNILVHADPRLVVARSADVAKVVGATPAHRELLALHPRLIERSDAELWQDLDAFCEQWKDVEAIDKLPYPQGVILIRELGRRGVAFPAEWLPDLRDTGVDPVGEVDMWRLPLLIELAGLLGEERAIPHLVANIESESDILVELSIRALANIATESVQTAARAAFHRADANATISFSGIIECWHSDAAVELGVEFLRGEKDTEYRNFHLGALARQLSTEGNEAIFEVLGDDLDQGEFIEPLYWSCRLLGQDHPKLSAVLGVIEADAARRAKSSQEARNWMKGLPRVLKPKLKPAPGEKKSPGKNDPCPCGSGRRFKKCCLLKK